MPTSEQTKKKTYTFPEDGIVVVADSVREAEEKLAQIKQQAAAPKKGDEDKKVRA